MNAELARLVRGGCHDATVAGPGPDHDRAAAVLGVVALFAAGVERVEIDMRDPAMA
jgi:hypothetical protein